MATRASKNSRKKKKSSSSNSATPLNECTANINKSAFNDAKIKPIKTIQLEFIKECMVFTESQLAVHIMNNEAEFDSIIQCENLSNPVMLLLVELLNSKYLLDENSKSVEQANLIFAKLPDANLLLSNNNLPRFINAVFENDFESNDKKRAVENKNTAGLRNIIHLFRTLLAKFPKEKDNLSQIINSLHDKMMSSIYNDVIPDDIPTLIKSLHDDFKCLKKNLKEITPLKVPEDPKQYGLPFREISIFPCYAEVVNETSYTLRALIKKGEYANLETYLDIHFKLLREDMICPLRKAVGHLLQVDQNISNELYMYDDVKIIEITTHNTYGMVYKLKLWPFGIKSVFEFDWSKSSRLKYGSLVCISSKSENIYPNFKDCFWAIVTNSDDVKEKFEVSVKFENRFEPNFQFGTEYFMFESREVYFEAYFHTLSVLKEIVQKTLPFEKLILGKDPKCLYPYYMNRDSIFNVSCIFPNRPIVDPLRNWYKDSEKLNPSQLDATKLALTTELTLIQGPPGTGKTYVGSCIIEILMNTRKDLRIYEDIELYRALNHYPIIIVTFTNHALDQFLVEVLKFEENIIRLGSRSESDVIKSKTLYETKSRAWNENAIIPKHIRTMRREIGGIKRDMNALTTVIEDYSNQLKSQNKLTDADLKVIATETQYKSLHEIEFGNFAVHTNDDTSLIEFWLMQKDSSSNTIVNETQPISNDYNPFSLLADRDLTIPTDENIIDKYKMVERRCEYLGFDISDETPLLVNGTDVTLNPFIDSTTDILSELNPFADSNPKVSTKFNPLLMAELPGEAEEDIPMKLCCEPEPEEPEIAVLDTLIESDEEKLTRELKEQEILNGALDKLRYHINKEHHFSYLQENLLNCTDLWTLCHAERVRLYQFWVDKKTEALKQVLADYAKDFENLTKEMKSVSDEIDLHYLKDACIVGMTTTGAARYSKLLKSLKPRIIFVEEAAEVLEAHIITSLSESVEHLILIGDHEQLRPRGAVDRLAKDYNLNLSLFERLINNDVEHVTLNVQHRMRPEISALIKPIYPQLTDHESVKHFPNIRGIAYNVFFVSHDIYEDELQVDSTSRSNTHEASFIVKLYLYLIHHGYKASEITILTFYNDQKNLIISLIEQEDDIDEKLTHENISTVDKYQGEENKIILLSVVRGNRNNYIGHCCVGNRVCVAFTRAKEGLYVIGNEKCLRTASRIYMKNDLWSKIIDNFKEARGDSLPLCCVNHATTRHYMKSAKDFESVKDGGCTQRCDKMLDCGHECPKMCHPGSHEGIICKAECTKILSCNHKCKGMCSRPCNLYKCMTPMAKKLKCGHTVNVPCGDSSPDQLLYFVCTDKCEKTLPCGHKCSGSCGKCLNDTHICCQGKCEKILSCGHVCKSSCHFPDACFPCQEESEIKCSHITISRKCYVSLTQCTEPCSWKCEHHACKKKCGEICDRERCDIPCKLRQKCDHPCLGLCGEICPDLCKFCSPDNPNFSIFFGNEEEPQAKFIMLNDCKHILEVSGLDEWVTKFEKSEKIEIAKCPKKDCNRYIINTPRYKMQLNKSLHKIEAVKTNLLSTNKYTLLSQCKNIISLYGNNPSEYFKLVTDMLIRICSIIPECQINILLIIADLIQMFSEIYNHHPLVWQQNSQHSKFLNHYTLDLLTSKPSDFTDKFAEQLRLEFSKCQISNNFLTINAYNLSFQDQETLSKLKKKYYSDSNDNKYKKDIYKQCETFFSTFSSLPTPVNISSKLPSKIIGWQKSSLGHAFEVDKSEKKDQIELSPTCYNTT